MFVYDPLYIVKDGIRIYSGDTTHTLNNFTKRKAYWMEKAENGPDLFAQLTPSTLTAHGRMAELNFMEDQIITMLSEPTGAIKKIGCNFGELFNSDYANPSTKPKSNRGRKPKEKKKSTRKVHGTGRYFNSQITFDIQHPDTSNIYKIKLFRNGVFQVPGVKDPSMFDLIKPIEILKNYLSDNFMEQIDIVDFRAVMRNNKTHVVSEKYHVHLERLRSILEREKNAPRYGAYVDAMLTAITSGHNRVKKLVNVWNPMNIAEIMYNTDKCFALIIKFYRPAGESYCDKKTTVKFLKNQGKINFDGGNSQQEIDELYHWLHYIYKKHRDTIIFDVEEVDSDTPSDLSDCSDTSIYDDDSEATPRQKKKEAFQRAMTRDLDETLELQPRESVSIMRDAVDRHKQRNWS